MAYQLPLVGAQHDNQGLFSDYYLNEKVPQNRSWQELRSAARLVFEALRARLTTIQPEALDEAQLEEQWIKFVLEQIGWHYSVQVKIRYQTTHRKPDYALTASAESARALTNEIYAPVELRAAGVLAVADAKKWSVNLDQAARGERNPSQQIDEYLRYSELPWGILTDGRWWRLYERDSSKNNVYYAVDLPQLLHGGDLEAFLYFYAFFRQAAFTPGGWLEEVRRGSSEFAQRLSDTLEDQVYDALELIAQGFLDYRRNDLKPTPATLHEIYEHSLVLLYRLLFILYAESRDILPLRDSAAYRQSRSLYALKTAITRGGDLDADGSDYYGRLKDLFFNIDQGNTHYNLPAYNGGLFSAADHPFLDRYTIGDKHLVPALDKMARVPDDSGKLVMVDYRDLEVRHLGAIYEKLLEYRLDRAAAPLTVKEGSYVPAKAGEKPGKRPGEVYLRTGSNQRKVTGSYYTPDYIVRFIVERTLEPLLTAITDQYATRGDDGHWHVREPERLRDAILALNILDPATGSGHFLVDAMAYVAEWLRGLALVPADLGSGEDELLYWKRQVVSACIYGVDLNPLAVELAKLSLWLATLSRGNPLSFLDHHIKCGNSLIGAWAQEIGTELMDPEAERRRKAKQIASAATGQLTLFDDEAFAPAVSFAVDQMSAIEHTIVQNVEQVKQQETLFRDLNKRISPWRLLADMWTARYFGLALTKDQWQMAHRFVLPESTGITPAVVDLINRAEALGAEQHFLHWDFMFPEVFFNADGISKANPGFDAIIGNPPYVRQEFIQPIKNYLAAQHSPVYDGSADLYVYFYHRGLQLLKRGGLLAYITANKWFRAGYGEGLRGFLSESSEVREIVDFGHAPIFRGVDTFPAVIVLHKPFIPQFTSGEGEKYAQVTIFPRDQLNVADLKEYTHAHGYHVPTARFGKASWSLERDDAEILMAKMRQIGIMLREFIQSEPIVGIKTGFNEAFLIDTPTKEHLIQQDPHCADIIKPFLRGENIERWSPHWADEWMILLKSSENQAQPWSHAGDQAESIFAQSYPSIYEHFKPLEARLRKRQDKGRFWWELRSCTYYQIFENPKLIYQEIQTYPAYGYDNDGYYANNKCFVLPSQDLYLLAVLNSPLMWWHNWTFLGHMIGETLYPAGEKMVSLPIAPPDGRHPRRS